MFLGYDIAVLIGFSRNGYIVVLYSSEIIDFISSRLYGTPVFDVNFTAKQYFDGYSIISISPLIKDFATFFIIVFVTVPVPRSFDKTRPRLVSILAEVSGISPTSSS